MAKDVNTAPRLRTRYQDEVVAELVKSLNLSNVSQAPKLEKITVSVGLGRKQDDKRAFEAAENTLRKITGQQPISTFAKKSIASFKLREGSKIGMKVTLRGEKMYEFFDRLVTIVLPRVRDFHGIPLKSLDGSGNLSIGFRDQTVFPELNYQDTAVTHGVEMTISTSGVDNEQTEQLLRALGMPFEKSNEKGEA